MAISLLFISLLLAIQTSSASLLSSRAVNTDPVQCCIAMPSNSTAAGTLEKLSQNMPQILAPSTSPSHLTQLEPGDDLVIPICNGDQCGGNTGGNILGGFPSNIQPSQFRSRSGDKLGREREPWALVDPSPFAPTYGWRHLLDPSMWILWLESIVTCPTLTAV